MSDGLLRAVVSGRTLDRSGGRHDDWIARDIAQEARRQTVSCVLIDLRGLADRLGSLGALSMAQVEPKRIRGYRVAVVVGMENDPYYALHEIAACARG